MVMSNFISVLELDRKINFIKLRNYKYSSAIGTKN
jgi:hypothetical protein